MESYIAYGFSFEISAKAQYEKCRRCIRIDQYVSELSELMEISKELEPEIVKFIDEEFWNLI